MKQYVGIVIHCSATSWGNAPAINSWHKNNGWSGIGYHFVILNGKITNVKHIDVLDGSIECGRSLEASHSAHALGFNRTHIGICSISNGFYTPSQASSLFDLVVELIESYKMDIDNILGHNEVSSKLCPCFDVEVLRDCITYQDKDRFIEYMANKDSELIEHEEVIYVPLANEKEKV